MDMFSATSSWLQPHNPDLQTAIHHDARSSSANDWDKVSSSGAPTSAASPPAVQSFDLSEFGLGESATPTTTSLSQSSQPFFAPGFHQTSFYLPPGPGPYNAIPYGQSWAPSSSSSQVPLSTYSTLNGATTSSGSLQLQQQQQQPSSSSIMIDPALILNGGSSTGIPQQYSQSPSHYSSSQSPPPQQQHSQYSFSQHLHPSLSVNPAFAQNSHYYQQPPAQVVPQGTLSPQALHAGSNSNMSTIMSPSTFYSPSLSVDITPSLSPEAKKQQLQNVIRPLLQPSSFTGAGAVSSLVNHINNYGSIDIEPQIRLEILTKIRDNAGNHYFRAWSENSAAIEITREWLKAAFTTKADSQLVETIMPLLHIIDRLPLTLESLKSSKFGKLVVKLVKDPPTPAIKDMASNIERRWRQMLQEGSSKQVEGSPVDDNKNKKRKPTDPPPAKAAPPAKKVAVGPSAPPAKVPTAKDSKTIVLAVKDAKSDSSFFSAPKPKPKLPSFKKAPVPVKKEPDFNVAQPSSIDPFQEALKSMAKTRRESPAMSTPPPAVVSTPTSSAAPTNAGKKRKSVSWASDDQLTSIRLIERAVYDDDPVDGMHPTHDLRDLDRGEGAALHAHLFEEIIDWTDPPIIEIPIDIEVHIRGENSQEKVTQEEREQTTLVALYMSPAQIPESPAELPNVIPEEDIDKEVRQMTCGDDADSIFWSVASAPISVPSAASVADLVGQLSSESFDRTSPVNGVKGLGLDTAFLSSLQAMQSLSPERLQQLIQQAQTGLMSEQTPLPYGQEGLSGGQAVPYSEQQNWNSNQYSDYGQGYDEGGNRERRWGYEGRGRSRGRGRGRGRGEDGYRHPRRRPCSFFLEGRCRYGDQCDFSHDPIN